MSKKKSSAPKCPKCGGGDIVTDDEQGIMYCSECNIVVGEVLTNVGENFQDFRADKPSEDTTLVQGSSVLDLQVVENIRVRVTEAAKMLSLSAPVAQEAVCVMAGYIDYMRRRKERVSNMTEATAACILIASPATSIVELARIYRMPDPSKAAVALARLKERVMKVLDIATGPEDPHTTVRDRYQEMIERARAKLLIPGIHTRRVATAMAVAFEENVTSAKSHSAVAAFAMHTLLTTPELIELSGLLKRSLVPKGTRAEEMLTDRLLSQFFGEEDKGRAQDDFDRIKKFVTDAVRQKLLAAARDAVAAHLQREALKPADPEDE